MFGSSTAGWLNPVWTPKRILNLVRMIHVNCKTPNKDDSHGKYYQTLHLPHRIIVIHEGFQTLARLCIPDTTVKSGGWRIAFRNRETYMRPSMAQETISVPS